MPNNQEELTPVYLFVGFLESGKTKFIEEALEGDQFKARGKTLVIVCEEGEEEYDTETLSKKDIVFHTIGDEEELTEETLNQLHAQYQPDIVVMEYNGMWMLNKLFAALPENWGVFQCVMFADASTIMQYNANMRGLVADKINMSELIMFNRFDPKKMDPNELHQLVRGVNRKSQIYYETLDGKMMQDDIPDPLPYDLEADHFTVSDEDFAIFFSDIMEEPKKYKGKTVTVKGFAVKNPTFPKNTFAIGRHIMTCCVEDIKFYWLEVRHDKSLTSRNKQWVTVTAKIDIVQKMLQRKAMPVLLAESLEEAEPPAQEVATFY